MNNIKKNKRLWTQPHLLIWLFISLAVIMVVTALFELYQSRKEIYILMEKQAQSLIESIMISSKNSLLTNERFSALIEERLLNNAVLINKLYENDKITNTVLNEICDQNNIHKINIIDKTGEILFYSHPINQFSETDPYSLQQELAPIFTGLVDTLIIGIVPAQFEEGNRYTIAIATHDRNAIVLNIDAKQITNFKRSTGFGPLLRNIVSENPLITFAALQDTSNILVASGNVTVLETIQESEFLLGSLRDSLFISRIADFDSIEVFEVVHPFVYNGKSIGLLRLGLSMSPIQDINNRIYRRLIIITVILFIIGAIIFAYIFTLQNFGILKKQYSIVETYSSNIINHANDAIVVYNKNDGINIFNNAAENLFNIKQSKILGKTLISLFSKKDYTKINDQSSKIQSIDCLINKTNRYLLISKTHFMDDKDNRNTILLIRDLTDQRLMEEQMEVKQRLSAMGELASGVAHEIRNPLNTISTIIQQLDKDFTPINNEEEYHELSNIVYSEINRINETVKDFLHFAKPEEIKPELFELNILLIQLQKQYKGVLDKKNIRMEIKQNWNGQVTWDLNKMKQLFINLIDNAVDAIIKNGTILINIDKTSNDDINIKIEDNGMGMTDKIQSNVFNLYYTTKAKGTGIGLSIVQRIISEHNGTISISSKRDVSTTISIILPQVAT
ncbi:MAG: PAS domain-containing protein [Planctomycetia bacterium]|nr:PAS domain-containing protein [Planctomycetia bacterium]